VPNLTFKSEVCDQKGEVCWKIYIMMLLFVVKYWYFAGGIVEIMKSVGKFTVKTQSISIGKLHQLPSTTSTKIPVLNQTKYTDIKNITTRI